MQYVRSVEGRLVTRYGTGAHIGATVEPGKVAFNDAVVALTDQEWDAYRREYSRHLKNGDLELANEADYKASLKKIESTEKQAFDQAQAAKQAERAAASQAEMAQLEADEKKAAELRAKREAKRARPEASTSEPEKKDP